MTALTSRLNRDPVTWKPTDVGDSVEGVLIGYEERTSDYTGEPYPVLTIETDEGEELVWFASQAGARAQVERLRPQIGERVGAAYRGEGDAKPGQSPPKRFRFLVDRPVGAKPPEPAPLPESAMTEAAGVDTDIPF
jgi:hypothetical protein